MAPHRYMTSVNEKLRKSYKHSGLGDLSKPPSKTPVPDNAPYISRVKDEVPKGEEVFRSFLDAKERLKLETKDWKHFDSNGNPINELKQGGFINRKVLYNNTTSKKIKKRKR